MYTLAVTSAHPAKSGNVYFDFNHFKCPLQKWHVEYAIPPEKRLKLKKKIEEKKIPVIVDNVQPSMA